MAENKTARINVLTTKTQKVELEEVSHEKKMSQGAIIREALDKLFDEYKALDQIGIGVE